MQEIAFPGFKFQKFSGDYPLISNIPLRIIPLIEKLRLIFFFTFCAFFLILFQIQV